MLAERVTLPDREHDFHDDSEQWDLHARIYFSEGVFPLLLHDNPSFVKYVMEE
jgi:hypothetical protein